MKLWLTRGDLNSFAQQTFKSFLHEHEFSLRSIPIEWPKYLAEPCLRLLIGCHHRAGDGIDLNLSAFSI